jgi:carboxypeptidase family protein
VRVDWRALIILAACAIIASPVALRGTTCVDRKPLKVSGLVCGRVFDPAGAVVPSADLQLLNETGAVAAQARADSNGDFTFSAVPKGKYRLTTSSPGWYITFGAIEITGAGARKCKPLTVTLGIHSCDGEISRKKPAARPSGGAQ